MARVDQFSGLAEFLAVAQHASFRAAGAELRVTPSAVSQAVRALETRLHMPLFARTTRNVALTEAGAALLARLSPAAAEIGSALDPRHGKAQGAGRAFAVDLAMLRVLPAYREAC